MNLPNLLIIIKRAAGIGDKGYGSFDEKDLEELIKDMPQRDWSNPANEGFEKEGRYFKNPQEYLNWKKQQRGGDPHVEFDKQLERVNKELGNEKEENDKITNLDELKQALIDLIKRIGV